MEKGQAISYIRFSSKAQAKGDSLRRQIELAEKYCQEHNLELLDTYEDLGISAYRGRNLKEGALKKLIQALENGKIPKGTFLIIESFDRLSRSDILTQQKLYLDLITGGLNIVTLADTDDKGTPTVHYHSGHPKQSNDPTQVMIQLIISLSIMVRANNESIIKSNRSRENWEKRKKEAEEQGKVLSTICPSWIEVSNGVYQLVPEHTKTVKEILKLYSQGMGYCKISNILRKEEIPVFTSVNNKNKDTKWDSSKISSIIKSPAIYGAFRSKDGKTDIDDYYPAILTKDEYYNLLESQSKTVTIGGETSKFRNTLRSIVKCGKCKTNLNYYTAKNGKWVVKGLRCNICNELTIRYDECLYAIVHALSYNIGKLIHDQDQSTKEQVTRNNSLKMQLRELEGKIRKINSKIISEGDENTDYLLDLLSELNRKKNDLTAQITPIKKLDSHLSIFGDEIITNGFLNESANRKEINGFIHALLSDEKVHAYRYSQNNSSILIHTPLPVHVSIYRRTQRQPWQYCTMEAIDEKHDWYDRVGTFPAKHEKRNQQCLDYNQNGGMLYRHL